jgi:hypothetical protein
MKEIYSFDVERSIESTKPVVKKVKGETVQSEEKTIKKIKHKIVFAKPSMSMIEEAEFFYGQKFNELINSGFYTKAMLNKKMGDIGGLASKVSIESLQKAITDNIEASRVIEFYGSAKRLTKDQKEKLKDAKESFASTRTQVMDYEQAIRSQFSQTADVKAEQKLIEWLVFHLSFYEEEVDGKKQLFPIFEGDSFEEKRAVYLELCENLEDIEDPNLFKVKAIFDEAFKVLVRVASIWYNKIAEKPEEIKKAMEEMFADENEELADLTEEAETVDESDPEPALEPSPEPVPEPSPEPENEDLTDGQEGTPQES